jgi:hypothetical protein
MATRHKAAPAPTNLLSDLPLAEIPSIMVTVEVPINLSQEHKSQWNRLVNKFFHGKELIPLDETVSQDNKDAAWYVNAGKRTTLELRLYADGSMEVTEEPPRISRATRLTR